MNRLMRFSNSVKRAPAVATWLSEHESDLGMIARHWFEVARACGDDVRELLHDGHPTACVDDAAFLYVDVFTAHVNVGFYQGAVLPDPAGLLEGAGKYMRHVKLRPNDSVDPQALDELIHAAYDDLRQLLRAISKPDRIAT